MWREIRMSGRIKKWRKMERSSVETQTQTDWMRLAGGGGGLSSPSSLSPQVTVRLPQI